MMEVRTELQARNESSSLIEKQTAQDVLQLKNITWKLAIRQIIACCIGHLIVIQVGVNMSFSTIILAQLDFPIDKSEASWIASLVTISLPLGSLIAGTLMDKFGRKRLIIIALLPFIGSLLINVFTSSVWHLYIARTVAGFAGGLSLSGLVYVSEISHPDFRPMLLSLNSVFVSFGVLLTCFFGIWYDWRTISGIFCTICICNILILNVIPESPLWLTVFKKDPVGAAKSLRWIYKDDNIFENQYDYLIASNKLPVVREEKQSLWFRTKKHLNEYRNPGVYKPLSILLVIFVFQQFSGAYIFFFYAIDLFRKVGSAKEGGKREYVEFFLLGMLRFFMAFVAAAVSKLVGRRPLFICSGLGMTVTSLFTGLYLYYCSLSRELDVKDDYVPLVAMLIYVCLSSLALLVIPWTLTGELLPVSVRGQLSGFIISFAYVLMFGVIKGFPFVLDAVEIQWVFCSVAVVNLAGVAFVYAFLPETLGKTFGEIEQYFRSRA